MEAGCTWPWSCPTWKLNRYTPPPPSHRGAGGTPLDVPLRFRETGTIRIDPWLAKRLGFPTRVTLWVSVFGELLALCRVPSTSASSRHGLVPEPLRAG